MSEYPELQTDDNSDFQFIVWPLYWSGHGGAVVVDVLTNTIHPVSCGSSGVSR